MLRTGANIATYNHTGIDFGRGSMRYYSADARIEIGSYNGAALGSFVGNNYLRRITVGGGNDGLDPFVDLWATTTMRATLNLNFNSITNATLINGAETILFHNTSNRLLQSGDGQLNLLSPHQVNLGWTDGSSVTNILSVTIGQVSMFRDLNMQGNTITNQSDIRLKTNVSESQLDALKEIERMKFIEYDWDLTNPANKDKSDGRNFGIVAQYSPLLQTKVGDAESYLSIDIIKQINLNSKAIQELLQRIKVLEGTP